MCPLQDFQIWHLPHPTSECQIPTLICLLSIRLHLSVFQTPWASCLQLHLSSSPWDQIFVPFPVSGIWLNVTCILEHSRMKLERPSCFLSHSHWQLIYEVSWSQIHSVLFTLIGIILTQSLYISHLQQPLNWCSFHHNPSSTLQGELSF